MKKRIFYPVGLLAGFLLILIFLSGPILNRAGDFLAPLSKEKAEVVILEGTETIRNGAVKEGVDLLQNSKTRRLVVVMHLHEKEGQLFAIQEEYPRMLRKKLKTLGLREEQLEIILVPINDHPITLTEARFVMAHISERGCPKRRSGLRRVSYPQKLGGLPAGRGGIQDFSQAPPLFY